MLQKFRRNAALLVLDARPRARALRMAIFLGLTVLVTVAIGASVRASLLRSEARAMKRYLKTLEAFQQKRATHLDRLTTERDRLAWSANHVEELTKLAVQVGVLAARGGTRLSESESLEIAEAAMISAERHAVPAKLVVGVIMTESRFNRYARSDKGALGLMQLMPYTAEEMARDLRMNVAIPGDLFDPETNIELGTCYLGKLIRRKKSLPKALSAYNAGPARASMQTAYVGKVSRHSGLDFVPRGAAAPPPTSLGSGGTVGQPSLDEGRQGLDRRVGLE